MPHEEPLTFTSFSGKTRTVLSDKSRKADFSEIPIISLAQPRDDVVAQLYQACSKVGFFYIKDHGVSQAVIDRVFDASKTFFALPLEQKNETHFSKNKLLRGYEGPGDTIVDTTRKPDLNESFNWGYEAELDPIQSAETTDEAWGDNKMQGPNYWPPLPTNFRDEVAPYYAEVLTLARRLIQLFATALGAPDPSYFDPMFRRPGAMMRIIHYPPQEADDPTTLGIGAHQDIECFTILCQGQEAGLQILNGRGEWIEAPPIPGAFVVNIGDMMSRWSNDVFTSTLHRVINKTGRERYSIPFFFGPSYDTVIATLPFDRVSADGKEAPHYEPVQAGDYVWKRLAKQKVDGTY